MRLRQARAVFTSSSRAVCREMKENSVMALAAGISKEVKVLVAAAIEQGWSVEPNGSKLRWRSPDGAGMAFTAMRVAPGRDLKNLEARLQRAGLILSDKTEVIDLTTEQETIDMTKQSPMARSSYGNPFIELVQAMEQAAPGSEKILLGHMESQMLLATEMLAKFTEILDNKETGYEAKVEKTLAELGKENERLANQLKKAQDDVSRLGSELAGCSKACGQHLERAQKAEAKLAAFRAALSED